MDEKDLRLVKNIIKKIKKVDNPGTILLDAPTTQIAKTNFFLLKGLLDLEDEKGYYITLDRPHQNMAYLLKNHKINQENIWYIDAVTNLSSGKKINRENVEFLDNAFQIENLTENIKDGGRKRSDFRSVENIDFILIDNLGPMLNYNKIDKIQEFVSSFEDLIISQDDLIGCLVMDSETNEDLDRIVRGYVKSVIDVKKLKEDA